jgi:RecB family exonuclease
MATKVIPIKQITAWSFSRYSDYKKCPALAKYKHIDKLKEPGSAAMDRGTAIHKLAEDYTLGKIKALPPELLSFKPEFAAVKKLKSKMVEEQWAYKADWSPAAWNDWSGAWLRVKMDLAFIRDDNTLVVIDHKTGKFRPEQHEAYVEQLELYAAAGFVQCPDVLAVEPRLWYIDEGLDWPPEDTKPYLAKDAKKLRTTWEKRVKPMLNDTTFAPKPGDACRWCHFRRSNGGPCKF